MKNSMIRNMVAASALVMFSGFAVAQAPSPATGGGAGGMTNTTTASTCDASNMKMAEESAMKMTNATMKTNTMKELDMAKAMMAKNDMAGCKMHMDKASTMMK
ncbi:MAG: hypothetical protein JWN07_159 [Hyphomicrobiales bacterium]|nr:hypothetical protein [Hyphomicrobiales bacterium]